MDHQEMYQKLVSRLSERTIVKQQEGLEGIVKKIPDSDAEGELDPRVFQIRSEQAIMHQSVKGENAIEQIDLENQEFPLEEFRAMMGWKNKDLTRTNIQTTYRTISGSNGLISLRIYRPETRANESVPAILFYHGGGFIGGSVDTVENPCKALAEKAGAVVISVDYRLAPEHPFPSGLMDCYDTVQWVHQHAQEIQVNPSQIAVCGDSAGGNLATVCAMMDRDAGAGIIKYQALIYPTVNMGKIETDDFRWDIEHYQISNHRDLIRSAIGEIGQSGEWLEKLYLQSKTEVTNPHVSPLIADDLSGMPETLIITAEFDYLRLECEAYARKLSRSGVRTKLIQYNGMDHAFIDKLGIYPQAEDCMGEIALEIKRRFS
ncbi:alpha/beta hydrolase [Brevibacillus fluminis]|uniref:Alpha/beta hydrolase n=1 Tax=Brevibacillus fluminis TaxID=511487 RepID=A0A3M8DQH6_9BACL|nr:alpha/beta hydrolase [Brevibacillus fluminis]RNB89691.1 alpha/beta hydrolase [Brevibacillus fluminis]